MKRACRIGFTSLLVLLVVACGPNTTHEASDRELLPEPDRDLRIRGRLVQQLQGHWSDRSHQGEQEFHEVWSNDGSGIGSVMVGSDTVWTEHLTLRSKEADGLEYVATVPTQNDGDPIPFLWRATNDSTLLFVNEAHDFPQRIAYVRTSTGWRVTITGTESGQDREEVFHFVPHGTDPAQ